MNSPAHTLFKVPPEPLDASGYFWFVCMMNHSCAPNGGVAYDPPAGTAAHPRQAPHAGGGECHVSPPATARIFAKKRTLTLTLTLSPSLTLTLTLILTLTLTPRRSCTAS